MQVVTIAVYIYFMSLMFAYQHDQEQNADFFLLVPACMQLFFYIGWLKACFILYSLRSLLCDNFMQTVISLITLHTWVERA